jgi:hypothetical protein
MSYGAWELVKNAKEEIIRLINISATKVPHDAPGNDLAMMILNVTANLGKKLPNDIAIEFIKKCLGAPSDTDVEQLHKENEDLKAKI